MDALAVSKLMLKVGLTAAALLCICLLADGYHYLVLAILTIVGFITSGVTAAIHNDWN